MARSRIRLVCSWVQVSIFGLRPLNTLFLSILSLSSLGRIGNINTCTHLFQALFNGDVGLLGLLGQLVQKCHISIDFLATNIYTVETLVRRVRCVRFSC